jgi:hypothetical protein
VSAWAKAPWGRHNTATIANTAIAAWMSFMFIFFILVEDLAAVDFKIQPFHLEV